MTGCKAYALCATSVQAIIVKQAYVCVSLVQRTAADGLVHRS